MKFRALTAVGATVIGAMTVVAGPAAGDPAPELPDAGFVDYATKIVDRTIVTRLKGGTFELVDKPGAVSERVLDLKDETGHVALEMPLNFRLSGVPVPVAAAVKEDGRVLEITPEQPADVDRVHPVTSVHPIASDLENQRAINDFVTKMSLGAGIGTVIGAVVGVAIGVVLGVPIGAAVGCAVDAATLCVPGLVVGAVAGPILGAFALGVIGAAIGSGPTVTSSGVDMLNTLQAPPGTTPWADLSGPSDVRPPAPAAPAPPAPAPAAPGAPTVPGPA
ncbi:hypothetical protein BJY24_002964 [Nocardia transvalensis]|uniref:DUF8020 domain-containing protein n=1 Tax=Nocardia transvalensis TaxID=37333 RepID=A0A7W9PDG4_9NOCA|nr:hypothetical protein [Nocardia transvalensis]MBB5914097.1 hypothetical protein [Nocardia transvalensis]